MAIAIGIAWLVFICLGVPIAFVLGASAMVGVLLSPDGLDLMPALVEQMFIAISSSNFLAIPLTATDDASVGVNTPPIIPPRTAFISSAPAWTPCRRS